MKIPATATSATFRLQGRGSPAGCSQSRAPAPAHRSTSRAPKRSQMQNEHKSRVRCPQRARVRVSARGYRNSKHRPEENSGRSGGNSRAQSPAPFSPESASLGPNLQGQELIFFSMLRLLLRGAHTCWAYQKPDSSCQKAEAT